MMKKLIAIVALISLVGCYNTNQKTTSTTDSTATVKKDTVAITAPVATIDSTKVDTTKK